MRARATFLVSLGEHALDGFRNPDDLRQMGETGEFMISQSADGELADGAVWGGHPKTSAKDWPTVAEGVYLISKLKVKDSCLRNQ